MRKFVIAALVVAAAWTGTPAANALCVDNNGVGSGPCPNPEYTGKCRISTVNDTSPDGTLGGQNVWNGQVNILVVANAPGAMMKSASCWIKVNGGTESPLLDAVVAGGVGIGAGRATFTAEVTDTVSLCTHVDITGPSDICEDLVTTPICPDPVCGPGGVLDQVDAVIQTVTSIPDFLICPILIQIAPTVNGLAGGAIYIDPATGDTYIPGDPTDPTNLFWNCPPY